MHSNFHRSTVLRLCSQPRTFEYISKMSAGLDPIQISEILKGLVDDGKLIKKDSMWVLPDDKKAPTLAFQEHDSHTYLKKHMGHFEFLKVPHP